MPNQWGPSVTLLQGEYKAMHQLWCSQQEPHMGLRSQNLVVLCDGQGNDANVRPLSGTDLFVQTILHAATMRQKLQIELAISPSHNILTLSWPVQALTLQHQAPGKVATGVLKFKSLLWLNLVKDPHWKSLFEPRSTSLQPDDLPLGKQGGDNSKKQQYKHTVQQISSCYTLLED